MISEFIQKRNQSFRIVVNLSWWLLKFYKCRVPKQYHELIELIWKAIRLEDSITNKHKICYGNTGSMKTNFAIRRLQHTLYSWMSNLHSYYWIIFLCSLLVLLCDTNDIDVYFERVCQARRISDKILLKLNRIFCLRFHV